MPRTSALIAAATLAAALSIAPASASARVKYGHTPSGNITCKTENNGGSYWNLTCSIRSERRTVKISTSGRAFEVNYRPVAKRGRVFGYDSGTITFGSFSCDSYKSGLSCMALGEQGGGQIFVSRNDVSIYN